MKNGTSKFDYWVYNIYKINGDEIQINSLLEYDSTLSNVYKSYIKKLYENRERINI